MITVQFITSPGCAECEKVKQILQQAKSYFPHVEIKEIDIMSPKGIRLMTRYGIMANPGVILNDELFSAGNLNKERFFEKIKNLTS